MNVLSHRKRSLNTYIIAQKMHAQNARYIAQKRFPQMHVSRKIIRVLFADFFFVDEQAV